MYEHNPRDPITETFRKHENICPGFYIKAEKHNNILYEVCTRCLKVLKFYYMRSKDDLI